MLDDQNGQRTGTQCQQRSDRQINTARDQHKGHSNGDQRQRRDLIDHGCQSCGAQKVAALAAKKRNQQPQHNHQSGVLTDDKSLPQWPGSS